MNTENEPTRGDFSLLRYLLVAVPLVLMAAIPPSIVVMLIGTLTVISLVAWMRSRREATATKRQRAVAAKLSMNNRRGIRRWEIGPAELFLIAFGAILIAMEVWAIFAGIGPIFAVITLGYFLAAGGVYLVYANTRRNILAMQVDAGRSPPLVSREIRELIENPEMPVEDLVPGISERETVRRSDLLRGLTDIEVERVLAAGRWESISAGTPLAEAGTLGSHVYVIAMGQVELAMDSEVGELTVRVAGPGESLPLAALLGEGVLVTSVRCMTDIRAWSVDRLELLRLCRDETAIGMKIFKAVAETLAERYRTTLMRHMRIIRAAVRDADVWTNL